jgi:hypothetical protein
MMQPELPKIDFADQAEIWSKAEHRRAEEISGWLKLFLRRRRAKSDRCWYSTFDVARYEPASARTGEHRRAAS